MSRMPPWPVLTSVSAGAALPRLVLDAPLQGLDLVDLGERQIFAIDERLDRLEEPLAERQVAGHRPHLDERLPLPGAAERVVVGQRAGQRPGQRAALAFRPQTQVDAVGLAAVGVGRQQADHLADDAAKELVVADAGDPLAARGALVLVEEHQVDVAGVVQLLAAVLAEGQDDAARPAGRPRYRARRSACRRGAGRRPGRLPGPCRRLREMSRVISSSGRSRMMSLVPMRSSCRWRKRRKTRRTAESS